MLYSASKLDCFQSCPRKYYYTYILGYRGSPASWQVYGTKIDNLLAIYDKSDINHALSCIKDFFQDPYDQVKAQILLTKLDSEFEKRPPVEVNGKAGNQHYFRCKLPIKWFSQDIEIEGYTDKVIMIDNQVACLERKTTSENISHSAEYWDGLQYKNQTMCYSVGLGQEIDGEINLFIYEVFRKLTDTVSKAFSTKDVSVEEFTVNAFKYFELPKTKQKDVIVRKGLYLSNDMREDWMMSVLAINDQVSLMQSNMTQIISQGYSGEYAWPKIIKSCNDYGKCPFWDYCTGACGNLDNLQNVFKERKGE